jgi:hypothetical protein
MSTNRVPLYTAARAGAVALAMIIASAGVAAQVKITARARPAASPPWSKGLQPVTAESYYNAIECGKQGGDNPACVFWDTDLCKNDDFTLTWYSGYKQVAYEVWTAVRRKQPAPQPNFQAAQRTRVTIALTPAKGSKNALSDFAVVRGGKRVMPMERALSGGGGRFVFDYPAFAPNGSVTLEMIGKERTVACVIPSAVLRQLR